MDDQTVVREGLAVMLALMDGIEVAGTADDGEEALRFCQRTPPDVVLMDIKMPRRDGIEATRQLAQTHPGLPVVVLTTYADDESVFGALRAGARGYLTKDASADEIERAVRDAWAGRTQLDPVVQARLVELVANGSRPVTAGTGLDRLTERETEVLRLMAEGLGNRDIAARLFVTEATVKTHVNNLFSKLSVNDRAAAVALAYRSGLVS